MLPLLQSLALHPAEMSRWFVIAIGCIISVMVTMAFLPFPWAPWVGWAGCVCIVLVIVADAATEMKQ